MKTILEMLKRNFVNVFGFILFLAFGIYTYQTTEAKSIKYENELYTVLFTPLNVAIGESILLMLGFLVLVTFLTKGIKKLEIAGLFGFEVGDNKKILLETATKPLKNQKFLRTLRKVKYQVMAIVKSDSTILELVDVLAKEVEIFYKNESNLNIPISVFEIDGTEDEVITTLLNASLESGNAEIYEDSSLVRNKNYMAFVFVFEGKRYGIVSTSYKYKFDESDSELLLGIVGLAEDWYEISQAYIALSDNN